MLDRSHITNEKAMPILGSFVRTCLADRRAGFPYIRNMARRGIPKGPIAWYLREWMAAKGITRQAEMCRLTGWSKATMSQLYNGRQDYSPKILKEAADALQVERYELLMPPEHAMAIRRLRQDALRIVEDGRPLDRTGTEG